jgi:flagellar biogenesis protein FliO
MHVLGLVARVGGVFGLLGLVLYVLRRTDAVRSTRRTGLLQVLGTTRVGKGAALTVVRIGDAEYVLGVTDHAVTLLTPTPVTSTAPEPATAPAPAPVAVTAATPAVAPPTTAPAPRRGSLLDPVALGARLGTALAARLAARRGTAPAVELSTVAVSTALASLQDEAAPAENEDTDVAAAPAAAAVRPRTPARHPLVVADGPSTPTSRHALRRAVARTDALRDEEHPWTRSCRPTSRSSARAALLD